MCTRQRGRKRSRVKTGTKIICEKGCDHELISQRMNSWYKWCRRCLTVETDKAYPRRACVSHSAWETLLGCSDSVRSWQAQEYQRCYVTVTSMSLSASQTDTVRVPFVEIFNHGTLRYMKRNLLTQSQYPYWEAERGITAFSRFLELLKIHSPDVCSLSLLMTWTFSRFFAIPVHWEALMLNITWRLCQWFNLFIPNYYYSNPKVRKRRRNKIRGCLQIPVDGNNSFEKGLGS